MINRKTQVSGINLTVNGSKEHQFAPDMSIRKLGLSLKATYTNGSTAVTNSTLKTLGMYKVNVKINGVPYHTYEPETIIRINEARGYVPQSTDCNAIGNSTAGTVYAVFELPVAIVKTAKVKTVEVEIVHATTGAGSTNAGTVTVPQMDLIVYYDDTVCFTNRFLTVTLPSATSQPYVLPQLGLLDMITTYGAADYFTAFKLEHNAVPILDLPGLAAYEQERVLRLQGTRLGYGSSFDTDNVPVEGNTKVTVTCSTAQETKMGLLYLCEVKTSVLEMVVNKALNNLNDDTVSVVASELEDEVRLGGIDIPIQYPDHPFGEISM